MKSICYLEYGAEGMPNLHSKHPKRGDHSEEYQSKYHEYMLRCFKKNPFMYSEPIKLDFIINLILHYYWIYVYTL